MYALGILLLLSLMRKDCEELNIRHAAYADGISGVVVATEVERAAKMVGQCN